MRVAICAYCRHELNGETDEANRAYWLCVNPACPAISYRRAIP
jgi:hypothetical protein